MQTNVQSRFARRVVMLLALSVTVFTGTAWSTEGTAKAAVALETVDLTCLLCLEIGGQHAFLLESEPFCTPGAGNNEDCAACGGTSECHDELQLGPCHQACSDPQFAMDDQERLIRAVELEDARSIVDIMELAGDALSLNLDRSAFQAKGCGDNISLHLPVSGELLDRLNTLLDR